MSPPARLARPARSGPLVPPGWPGRLRVHVSASDPQTRAGVLALLRHSGVALAAEPGPTGGTVALAAGATVEAALAALPAACLPPHHRVLLMADAFPVAGARAAVRAGVYAMLRLTRASPAQLSAAVRAAARGDGHLPYDLLVRLLAAVPAPADGGPGGPLTPRQAEVLALVAEGHDNASIAQGLSCSEHTVKNVVYELSARLQARNRAHAVARAVRLGLL